MKLLRVFPRRTNATPVDSMAHIGSPDLFSKQQEPDKIHISVAFSWDLPQAERLCKEWSVIAPAEIGGPATGQRGEAFTPGLYLREGCVITSRGCPNRCWFCSVWKREGEALRAYALCGYPKDTFEAVEKRFMECIRAGFMPMAMLYRDKEGERDPAWARFQREWARPATIYAKIRESGL